MKVLCELVTVNRERDAIEPLSDWEGGIAVRICKSGDLPAEDSGSVPVSEYQSSGRNRYADPGATSNWSQMSKKIQHHCVLLPDASPDSGGHFYILSERPATFKKEEPYEKKHVSFAGRAFGACTLSERMRQQRNPVRSGTLSLIHI